MGKKIQDKPTRDVQMHERKYQHHVHLHVIAEASHSAIQVLLAADLHDFRLNVQQVDLMRRQEAVKATKYLQVLVSQRLFHCMYFELCI